MSKKKQIKIFIISTFCNVNEKDFSRGVKSIHIQNYENFEWIIINDGSNNKVDYKKILKENNFFLYFPFKQNVGINKRLDFGIRKVLERERERESLIFIFDLDDEIVSDSLFKINKIYQKINFDILFFYKMDYIWNELNKKEINYMLVDEIYKNKINIKKNLESNLYKLSNIKNNYFLYYKLASTSGPTTKIYSTKLLFEMNQQLKLNSNFFYDKKLYKNFDFKLSYLSAFYSNNIVLVNDKYYKYYVASESSITKNDKNFQTSFVYSNLINFLKSNIKTWKKNNNYKKVIWIFFLLLYSMEKNKTTMISLIKIKTYLFFLIKEINKDEEFKKLLPLKKITIVFIIKTLFKKIISFF